MGGAAGAVLENQAPKERQLDRWVLQIHEWVVTIVRKVGAIPLVKLFETEAKRDQLRPSGRSEAFQYRSLWFADTLRSHFYTTLAKCVDWQPDHARRC